MFALYVIKLTINNDLVPNIPIRRLVNELSIRCINEKCNKVIKKADLMKHLETCEYQRVNCSNSETCGLIERQHLKTHETEKWPFRMVTCKLRCGMFNFKITLYLLEFKT